MSLASEAFRISYQQLRSQKEDLKALRGQAATSAAMSGLVATVFSAIVASTKPGAFSQNAVIWSLSLEAFLVIATLMGSLGFAIRTISGWSEVDFDLNPETWIYAIEHRNAETGIEDNLAKEMAAEALQYFRTNEKVLDEAKSNLFISLLLAFGQIPAWILMLN